MSRPILYIIAKRSKATKNTDYCVIKLLDLIMAHPQSVIIYFQL